MRTAVVPADMGLEALADLVVLMDRLTAVRTVDPDGLTPPEPARPLYLASPMRKAFVIGQNAMQAARPGPPVRLTKRRYGFPMSIRTTPEIAKSAALVSVFVS